MRIVICSSSASFSDSNDMARRAFAVHRSFVSHLIANPQSSPTSVLPRLARYPYLFRDRLARLARQRSRKGTLRGLPLHASLTPVQWISEVLHFCQGLPIILVACKKDLRNDPKTIQDLDRMNQRPVPSAEGLAVAQKIGAQGYVECSAKTGEGVREVFQTATRQALQVRHADYLLSQKIADHQSKKSGRSKRGGKSGCVVL